jgi:hypothetical protein
MSFENTVATRLLLTQARRANTKRGARYLKIEFEGLKVVKSTEVYATRTTRNCIWFEDGSHIARDTGKLYRQPSDRIITYIPAEDANSN